MTSGEVYKSSTVIPKSLDNAMDKATPPAVNAAPGISIRHGPMDEMEVDGTEMNGQASTKRKARASNGASKSYKEASDDEDAKPLVCWNQCSAESECWRY